ncbi:phage baseplate assembly protein V [Paracoccus aminovorans]|uniref:phage baseplate assembly protein V n=1 Tax=Paracoccus aminovorans TaxID=34004 RepID=UPI0007860D6A|nr:phage baseplate assembly protein V [Paracoccus aminovorans]
MTLSAAEADRRIANVLTVGTVVSIDNGSGRARVRIGELETPPIPVMQLRSGTIRMHWMPSPGEQVTIAAPSGDMARAFVMGALPIDGNMVAPDAGSPTMDLGGGTLRIIGNLYIEGDVEVTGDVVASGVSLVHHTHGGVQRGGADTEEPN